MYIFPSPDEIREARKFSKDTYTNSFRPEVTDMLLNNKEKQALFVGTVRPEAIECVYHFDYGTSGSLVKLGVEDYVEKYGKDMVKKELTDTRASTLKDFIRALQKAYYQPESEILGYLVKELSYCKSFEAQIQALEDLAPYSVAKKIVTEMRNKGLVDKLKSVGTKRIAEGL